MARPGRTAPPSRKGGLRIEASGHSLTRGEIIPAPPQLRDRLDGQHRLLPAYATTALNAFRPELERLGGWQLEVRRLLIP